MIFPAWADKWSLLATEQAEKWKLPSKLIAAVIQVESGGNECAIRYEPNFLYLSRPTELSLIVGCTSQTMEFMQKTSWGLMQVMGAVAYDLGLATQENKWPTSLTDPYLGADYGCQYLLQKFTQYGPDPARTYASYNAGSIKTTPGGNFVNQRNVDAFMRLYNEITQEVF